MTPSEKFFELLDRYNTGVEPLDSWDTDDLIELQMAIGAELQERDRIAQNEYFDAQEHGEIEDEFIGTCRDPLCPCHSSYGGTA